MCGKFVILTQDEVMGFIQSIEEDAPFPLEPDWPATRASAYPGCSVSVIVPGEDGLKMERLRWGFENPWRKGRIINTRIESALAPDAGLWAGPIREGRCAVPAAGFFEAHPTELLVDMARGKSVKREYLFSDPTGEPLLFAAVRGEGVVSIVTTEPNEWVSPVHDRMPLVLHRDELGTWLGEGYATLADRGAFELHAEAESGQRYQLPPEQQRLL